MSAMSNYLENEILDHILGTGSYTMPSAVYIGLSTGSFGDGNTGTELTGSGYARVSATFNAAASGTADNASAMRASLADMRLRVGEPLGEFAHHFRAAIISLAESRVKRCLNLCHADRIAVQLASQHVELTLC